MRQNAKRVTSNLSTRLLVTLQYCDFHIPQNTNMRLLHREFKDFANDRYIARTPCDHDDVSYNSCSMLRNLLSALDLLALAGTVTGAFVSLSFLAASTLPAPRDFSSAVSS
jgi:hypothetical protein